MTVATTYPEGITNDNRPYCPRGAAHDLWRRREEEILLSGPAGTGKSRACLEKLNFCAMKYAGMRGLIVRKTRESLTEAALVTYEAKVLPANSPVAARVQRRMRQSYQYPNGSEIVVGGLDKAQKVMSTEYDMVYVQEAIELTEADWEALTTRLRNGVMPYQQLIADTNPDTPTHWLKRRTDSGRTVMLESRHEDNPTVTPEYLAKLDRLTGPRKLRLRYGKWVAAEGLVYDEWDRAVHLVDRFEVPAAWPRYWTVDFGYTNPFVWQAWTVDPDGRLFRYREIYETKGLVSDHAETIRQRTAGEPAPQQIWCDHDAEGRATLEDSLGMKTTPAKKTVTDGIQAVQERLRPAGDGKPRLFLMRDSLVRRDEALADAARPTCTEEEIDGYVWDLSGNRKRGEEPVKAGDHGMDALRYMVAGLDLTAGATFHQSNYAGLGSSRRDRLRNEFGL